MIRINLLPHRELKRKAKREQFIIFAVITCLLGIAIIWGVHIAVADKLDFQNTRNQYLHDQTAILDEQIVEVQHVKAQISELLLRKDVVEDLQAGRTEVVHFFDQLVRLLPDGVYLHRLTQKNKTINIIGYAQSNAWVSTLMRNLESSSWLESPVLIEIKAVNINNNRLNEFNLSVKLVQLSNNDV